MRCRGHPSIGKFCLTTPLLLRRLVPKHKRLQDTRPCIHLIVHLSSRRARIKAALPIEYVLFRFRQEATCHGRVCVEGYAEAAESREEDGLLLASDWVVVSLVDGGEDVVVSFAMVIYFFDLR